LHFGVQVEMARKPDFVPEGQRILAVEKLPGCSPPKLFQPRKDSGHIALIHALPQLADLLLTPSADANLLREGIPIERVVRVGNVMIDTLFQQIKRARRGSRNSEIKALVEARAAAPEINYSAPPDYLANHAPSGEETLFSDFKRLLPGHTLTWRDGRIEIRKYLDLSFAQNGHPALSDRGAIVRIRKERPRIERKLNEMARRHDGRRVRYRGRLRAKAQYLLLAVVVDCKRIVRLLTAAPSVQPA
jgi:hypothetical protein